MTVTIHVCENIGLSDLTEVHVKEEDGKITARMGFSLFGSSNMTDEQLEACDYNPFHEDFFDNFVEGEGASKEEAIAVMKVNMKKISSSLWDE